MLRWLLARRWRMPIVLWGAVAAFNCATALMRGVVTAHEAALQWWVSIDAELPEETARWFLHGGAFYPGSDWSPLDRGPLQPVILIITGALFAGPTACYFVAVVVNSVWAAGLWSLFRVLGVRPRRIIIAVAACMLCGPIWLNTVYPWPKLLCAGLCLLCAAAIFQRRPVAVGIWAALAMLAHGTAIFVIVGLIPFAIIWLGRRSLVSLLIVAVPVTLWAALPVVVAAPAGPRLLQWHLAGTDIAIPDNRSPLVSIVSSYATAGWSAVAYKVNNLRVALGDVWLWDATNMAGAARWASDGFWGRLRIAQLMHLGIAPGVLWLGLVRLRRVPLLAWCLVGSWLVSSVIVEWGGEAFAASYLWVMPFALLVLLIASLAIGFGKWIVPVQAVIFFALWFPAPALIGS
jgi:hypothetical protein